MTEEYSITINKIATLNIQKMIFDKLKYPVYYFTLRYFTSVLSPYHFLYQHKQLKENTNEIRLILSHPEKQKQTEANIWIRDPNG